MTRYANVKALHKLPKAHVHVTTSTHSQPGPDGADTVTSVQIKNTSSTKTVAFFLRADLYAGSASADHEVLPVFWSDNDITLWPGETETLTASYRKSELRGRSPVVTVGGWNVASTHVGGG
jgi:exo-1,4-beta-D-glucosaminidase